MFTGPQIATWFVQLSNPLKIFLTNKLFLLRQKLERQKLFDFNTLVLQHLIIHKQFYQLEELH